MQIKRRPTALLVAGCILAIEWIIKPIWDGYLQIKLSPYLAGIHIGEALQTVAAYIPRSFGLGFVCGSLIFSYWDSIIRLFKNSVAPEPIEHDSDEDHKIRAWLGSITPFFDLHNSDNIRMMFSIICVGNINFRISEVRGFITLKHDDGNGKILRSRLPSPSIESNPSSDRPFHFAEAGKLFLTQPIPRNIAKLMPEMFTWTPYPNMDFRDLEITLTSEDGSQSKKLELWDSMRLSTGEYQVRYDETMRLFDNDDEARKFRDSLDAVSKFARGSS